MSTDAARIARVMSALGRLVAQDPSPWSQGLSPEGARVALDAAAGAITPEGLASELATPGARPEAVAVLVAWGVFTSPLEWVAMLAAAGVEVLLKPPSLDPAFCVALVGALQAEGLPASLLEGREIPPRAGVVLAFGSDQTMDELRARWPERRLILHGHRFSAALVHAGADLQASARALANDHALYDTRGCMAPTAIFTDADPQALASAMAEAMAEAEARLPCGEPRFPQLRARLRERVGLARVLGSARQADRWAVLTLPADRFVPDALPRVATLYALPSLEAAAPLLAPYRAHLSTLGAGRAQNGEDPKRPAWTAWSPRVCALGTMQVPPFPRLHDGRPMLASILGLG